MFFSFFYCLLLVFRNPVDFCVQQPCQPCISSFFHIFLLCNDISMKSKHFLLNFYIFIFHVLLCLLGFVVQCWLEVIIVDFLPMFLISRGTLSASSVSMVFAEDVFINAFYQVNKVTLCYGICWDDHEFFYIFDMLTWVNQFSEVLLHS